MYPSIHSFIYLSIHPSFYPGPKQTTLNSNEMESAWLPGNHFCQKYFSFNPGSNQQYFFLGKMLLQIVFLYLKQNIQGVFLSEAKKKKKRKKEKRTYL
jgi:hypothetical protein